MPVVGIENLLQTLVVGELRVGIADRQQPRLSVSRPEHELQKPGVDRVCKSFFTDLFGDQAGSQRSEVIATLFLRVSPKRVFDAVDRVGLEFAIERSQETIGGSVHDGFDQKEKDGGLVALNLNLTPTLNLHFFRRIKIKSKSKRAYIDVVLLSRRFSRCLRCGLSHFGE